MSFSKKGDLRKTVHFSIDFTSFSLFLEQTFYNARLKSLRNWFGYQRKLDLKNREISKIKLEVTSPNFQEKKVLKTKNLTFQEKTTNFHVSQCSSAFLNKIQEFNSFFYQVYQNELQRMALMQRFQMLQKEFPGICR